MRRSFLSFACLLFVLFTYAASPKPQIDRIDPPHWWIGMHCDTLQLMVSGQNIGNSEATLDYPGVKLIETVELESPDYQLLYLTIDSNTQPGSFPIVFTEGKKSTSVDYTLKARSKKPEEHIGFSNEDVLYLVMPDRFACGKGNTTTEGLEYPIGADRSAFNGRHGGNIAGLREHLGYIDSLGVTAIWVNPVLENDMPGGSYHGYATTDYYSIDRRFGTNDEYIQFIEEAHSKGLKVVMDMIFNHCGSNHPWVKNKPSRDWFNNPDQFIQTNFRLNTISDPYASDYDRDLTVNGWFVEAMPDLNQKNPHVWNYLVQNSLWWIEEAGINGIRMDTYPYADFHAMGRWCDRVIEEYPNMNIVGECWIAKDGGPAFWQKGSTVNPMGDPKLPTVMDFPLVYVTHEAFEKDGGLSKLWEHLGMDYLLADPTHILTFLDNHDTDRWLLEEPTNLDSWKQAQTFLLTTRGIPQIYYGTEILMNGDMKPTDGNVRLDFPGGFPGDTMNAFTAEGRTPLQNEAWDFLSKILNWRRTNEAVKTGSLKHFMPQNGVYVYQRTAKDGSKVVVVLNGNDKEASMNMNQTAESLPIGSSRRDVLTDENVTISETMTFSPRQILILE
ncbi:MAG: glycoside hydrolase family 13 protein [Bacteroidales bacterium]|nr:glycoside hydrolase family 13 protein [Bacteroidales bacterium]